MPSAQLAMWYSVHRCDMGPGGVVLMIGTAVSRLNFIDPPMLAAVKVLAYFSILLRSRAFRHRKTLHEESVFRFQKIQATIPP